MNQITVSGTNVTVLVDGRFYGSFTDLQDQTNAGATATNKIKARTTELTNGVSIVDDSKITIANVGVYDIQFSVQLNKSGGGTATAQIWVQKNGSNIADTTTEVVLSGNNARLVAAWNYFVSAQAGDFFELCWHSSDTGVFLDYIAPASNPSRPAIPSIIITVNQVA